jgi:hypothetical protein
VTRLFIFWRARARKCEGGLTSHGRCRNLAVVDLADIQAENIVVHPVIARLRNIGNQMKNLRKLKSLTIIDRHVPVYEHHNAIGLDSHARLHIAGHNGMSAFAEVENLQVNSST